MLRPASGSHRGWEASLGLSRSRSRVATQRTRGSVTRRQKVGTGNGHLHWPHRGTVPRRFILAFICGCALSSTYGFLAGTWPFGVVEAIWTVIALDRYRRAEWR